MLFRSVELARERKAANDLTRVTMGVSTTSIAPDNYLGLTGSNVVVSVNDTGVDINHPDLTNHVAFDNALSGFDTVGHGTHVAGIIAGDGTKSATVTFASGSSNPGQGLQYRGKAPDAQLYCVGVRGLGGHDPLTPGINGYVPDSYVQEQPAKAKALISNNSWGASGAGYDLSAASYDAAVRDALPTNTAPQPVLFVFSAGNDGNGNDNGTGGYSDTVASPGTAKNVITVGALEQFRHITNEVLTYYDGITYNSNGVPNELWYPMTDTNNQVASYSSRGNVGVGTEGTYGRFKPDVVAPGSMVVSTRSTTWNTNAYYDHGTFYHYPVFDVYPFDDRVDVGYDNLFTISVPPNAIQININISDPGILTPFSNPGIFVSTNATINTNSPATYQIFANNNTVSIPSDGPANYLQSIVANGGLSLLITDTATNRVDYNIVVRIITTNDNNFDLVLQDLNAGLGPYYLYENGTSMAAPAVSGTLALMQDFFTNTLHLTPSPALLKAMLINGARVTNSLYNYALTQFDNYQGWGLPQLPNSIPQNLATASSSLYFLDQSPTNVLATGDSRTFIVQPGNSALPLRITLAWTDPPGNPAAAVKLVNNLDLVVTNLTTGEVYYGNYFDSSSPTFSTTNGVPVFDVVNNVENVFIAPSLGTGYSVTVIGRSVNVNAVTTVATNIVQDFALVIALGDNSSSSVIVSPAANALVSSITPQVTDLGGSDSSIYYGQIAGANAPLLSTNLIPFGTNSGFATNAVLYIGQTNQWRFYVVSNATAYTNAAFIVDAISLSVSREGVLNGGPDAPNIDLYVATYPSDPAAASLTNLNPVVISNCLYGLNGDTNVLSRESSKKIYLNNSTNGYVYYIGVKSESQMGVSYTFRQAFPSSFGYFDEFGNQFVPAGNLPKAIPDGDNIHPGSTTNIQGFAWEMLSKPSRVTVTNYDITHQNFGDLYGVLAHEKISVVLNNHDALGPVTSGSYPMPLVYDDSGRGDILGSRHTDGPFALTLFTNITGAAVAGAWDLSVMDNASNHVGSVTKLLLKIEPAPPTNGFGTNISPMGWFYFPVVVPVDYYGYSLNVVGIDAAPNPPYYQQLYLKYNVQPTLGDPYVELNKSFSPYPWLWNSISAGPPLLPGTYWIGVYNPDPVNTHYVFGYYSFSPPAWSRTIENFTSRGLVPLKDDAVTTDTIHVPVSTNAFFGVNIGLRVDHPRISDLVFHLVDPYGARYLLMENRGNTSTNGCGSTIIVTNIVAPVSANGNWRPNTNYIDTTLLSGTYPITYNFYTAKDQMTVYYGTNVNPANLIYDTGFTNNPPDPNLPPAAQNTLPETFAVTFPPSGFPATSTYLTIIMNQYATNARGTAWTYTAGGVLTNYYYLTFTEDTSLTTTPIKFAPAPLVPPSTVDLYYQAEQSLSGLASIVALGADGDWQLEVMDNRAGAIYPAPALLSWRLGFDYTKAYPYLPGFVGQTNQQVVAGGIVWYGVYVPTNANFATNILSASGAVNLLFSTNTPPTTGLLGDVTLLASATAGMVTLSTNSTPALVPGGLYFLGVQNAGAASVNYSLEVDFDHGNLPPGPLSVKFASAKATASGPKLQWNHTPGSHYQLQWKDSLTAPWNTITNPIMTTSNGVSDFVDDGSQTAPVTGQRFYRLVWVP